MDLVSAKRELATASSGSDWNVRVDANGNPVATGEFVARSPIPYHYDGFVHDPKIPVHDRDKIEVFHRRELDLYILTASQSDTGRALLQNAYDKGQKIKFDPVYTRRQCTAAIIDHDPETRIDTMILNPFVPKGWINPAVSRGRTIAHEDLHVQQNEIGFRYGGNNTLQSMVMIAKAQEAAAHVVGLLILAELIGGHPDAPANGWKPARVEELLCEEPTSTQRVVKDHLPRIVRGDWQQFACEAFERFYHEPELYQYYDKKVLSTAAIMAKQHVDEEIAVRWTRSFMTDQEFTTHEEIVGAVRINDVPFLEQATFRLDDDFYRKIKLTPEISGLYRDLQAETNQLRARGFKPDDRIGFRLDTVFRNPVPVEEMPKTGMIDLLAIPQATLRQSLAL